METIDILAALDSVYKKMVDIRDEAEASMEHLNALMYEIEFPEKAEALRRAARKLKR